MTQTAVSPPSRCSTSPTASATSSAWPASPPTPRTPSSSRTRWPSPGAAGSTPRRSSTRKAATERPGLTAALDYLRRGDTLVVWKLDRLGRSVKEVLTIADDLHARGVGVKILTGKLSGSYSPTW